MAGKGQRFIDAGYTTPKPLLLLKNKQTIIDRILQEFYDVDYTHVISRNSCNFSSFMYPTLNNICIGEKPQYGQLYTVMEAIGHLKEDTGIIVANSDNIVEEDGWVRRWIQKIEKENPDGSICLMWGNHPKWSYARIANGTIVETAEKVPISEHATCGYYYFKNKTILRRAAEKALSDDANRVNNEFYLCPIYNDIIKEGGVVMPYWLNNFVGLGTPEDYERYLK